MLRQIMLVLLLLASLLLSGCGTSSMPNPTPAAVASPNAPATSTPTPTSPAAGAPNASTTTDSYLAQVFVSAGKVPMSQGQVTIDTTANNGAGNLQLTNVGANLSLVLQFCPYPFGYTNCITITPLTTDANGDANVNFTFPQKGTFSGVFQLVLNGGQFAATGTGSSGMNFQSALLLAGTVTGGINQTTGNAPGSGNVVVNGTTAHLTLSATLPNHMFNTAVCPEYQQTPCQNLANVTTDSNGNAGQDIGSITPAGWSVFRVSDSNGVQFVSAFQVE